MRFASKLLVAAVIALVAVAFGASSASAQVEVSDEATGEHCAAVTVDENHNVSGGCRIRAVTEVETQVWGLAGGIGFILISTCEEQFEAAIGEDGTGYLYSAIHTDHGPGPICRGTQCDEADHALGPWPITLESTSRMRFYYCLRDRSSAEGTAGTVCYSTMDLVDDGDHQYEFRATGTPGDASCGFDIRIFAHWNLVPDQEHPAIEIN